MMTVQELLNRPKINIQDFIRQCKEDDERKVAEKKYRRENKVKLAEERFWNFVVVAENSCWMWTGYMKGPSPQFTFNGKLRSANTVAQIIYMGKPENYVDQTKSLCGVKGCVNPHHRKTL